MAKYWTSLASVQNTSHQATPQQREEEGPKARQLGHLTPSRWTENPKVKAYENTKWHPITLCQVVHFLIKEEKANEKEMNVCSVIWPQRSQALVNFYLFFIIILSSIFCHGNILFWNVRPCTRHLGKLSWKKNGKKRGHCPLVGGGGQPQFLF